MEFVETSLPGVIRIRPDVYEDERGHFMETWQATRFRDAGIDADFVQDNFSQSIRGTLRGIHYQVEQAQGKLVRVVSGEVFDIAVDLRRSSPTFGQWVGETLSAKNRLQLWIPPGFGHGFLVTSETAKFEYKCSDYYAPQFERTIRWDDPSIGVDWPIGPGDTPLLSARDAEAPFLDRAETYP